MLRRSILEVSSRRSFTRNPTRITTQIPSYLSCRKQYSVSSEQNVPQGSGSTGKPPESGGSLPKIAIGSLTLGAALMTAYHLNQRFVEERRSAVELSKTGTKDSVNLSMSVKELQEDKRLGEQNVMSNIEESNVSSLNMEPAEENIETHSGLPHLDDLSRNEEESQLQVKDKTQLTTEEDIAPIQVKELPGSPQINVTSDESKPSGTSLEEMADARSTEVKPNMVQQEAYESTPILSQANSILEENEMKSTSIQQQTAMDTKEDAHCNSGERPNSLLDEYYLKDKVQETISTLSDKHKDLVGATEESSDVISKDGKLVIDFLQAIHTAEKRQAELDGHIFSEEKRKIKEKYEKELKDARARELMYAEEAAILDKELNRERLKAAAALKSLREELEGKLRMELEQKGAEAELNLKKIQELAIAELTAAIASEKASQIEKMAEANLHIDALCMAFFARSEEARQSHSAHKLALGALALEDALSKGLPIQKEIDALYSYLKDIYKDPFLDLVLSSLPEEARSSGTDTVLQLKHQFDALKGTLRCFSLMPPGGGGILAYSLAHIASLLKVREADQSGDGIESLMNRVESFLAEGKLSEAADTLENGVKGTQAAEVIGDWLRQVRNRAIAEQALTLLQSYATSISLT
ncbi:MICOS complex subunit MIC60, mitochondrial-like [Actinidia eriantha]|uniref:MICOS complex subunit MIC60, mitochondrial-like n=1 Tax=Actinidia eriantha TaxID=165200 RepID=UPI002589A962|nr:MICOS complex subunit MIC60, mitochondrial-like [Actinidia eriantha]